MRYRWGLTIIAVGVLVAAGASMIGLLHREAPPAAGLPGSTSPPATAPEDAVQGRLRIEGTEVTQRDRQGKEQWALQAGTPVAVDPQRKAAQASDVRWQLRRGGKEEWVVVAPSLLLHYESGVLEFSGGVELTSPGRGQRFTAQRLRYDPRTMRITGEGAVRFSQGKTLITGEQLQVDTSVRTVRVSGHVHARVGG